MSSKSFERFPDEVVIQILARLPVKCLFRAKTVCKLWNRLASEEFFVQLYNEMAARNPKLLAEIIYSTEASPSLICVDNSMGASGISLDFLNDRVKIRGSCNGLLCCSSITEDGVYYVCNPMTRKFRLLPEINEMRSAMFDAHEELTFFGLACDLSANKFSVVLVTQKVENSNHRQEMMLTSLIFDSVSNEWRKLTSVEEDYIVNIPKSQVVCVNNALYWLTWSDNILVLDLSCDAWRKITLPSELKPVPGKALHLLELDGCLSVIQVSESWMDIWVFKEFDTEKWCKVDRVSIRCITALVPLVFPICQTREFVLLATHDNVLVYHQKSKQWKEMYSLKCISYYPMWLTTFSFQSTMLSCH